MEDRRLVQLALIHKMVSEEQIAAVTREQQQLADRGINRSIWFLLTDLGFLSEAQARQLRKHISSSSIRALEIAGYVLQGRIGSGGMGDVFCGRNAQGGEAAIKLLSVKSGGDAEHARRFQREARAGMRLVHVHIARSLQAGEVDGQHYLVMELVSGQSLKQRIGDGGRMPEAEARILIWQIASALAYAWSHGVLHRDIKPANIMLGTARPGVDEPFCAKVCDFGLAKVWQRDGEGQDSTGKLTGTGLALGTPHYMAPEQASGEQDLDQRADIYSLGASVFNALLAKTVHVGKSSTQIMYKQVTEAVDLRPLNELGVSAGLVRMLRRMLERNRRQRYADWNEVIAAMRSLDGDMVRRQEAALADYAPVIVPQAGSSSAQTAFELQVVTAPIAPVVLTHPTRRPSPAQKARLRSLWLPAVLVAMLVMVVLVGGLILVLRPGGEMVTPSAFAQMLSAASTTGSGNLVLEPGDYIGPWRFGIAQSGLTLRARVPGTVHLIAGPTMANQAVLQLEPGLHDFRCAGITVGPGAGTSPSIEALTGAKATLQNLVVQGPVQISGADVVGSGLSLMNGITIDAKGHLLLNDSRIKGARALNILDGDAQLHCVLIHDVADSSTTIIGRTPMHPVVHVDHGHLLLDAVIINADKRYGGRTIGLVVSSTDCSLHDVLIQDTSVGVAAYDSVINPIEGLTIHAADTALEWWTGARDARWSWTHLQFTAPTKATESGGVMPLPRDGQGARPERLSLVPSPAGFLVP